MLTEFDYEEYKRKKLAAADERLKKRRDAAIAKRKALEARAQHCADLFMYLRPGDVIATDVGLVKVERKNKDKITNPYGTVYTVRQLFGAETARIVKEKIAKERVEKSGS